MFCKKCGTEIADDSIYCSKCGQKQDTLIEQNKDTAKETTQKETKEFQYPPEFQGEPYKVKTKKEEKGCLWWLCLIIVVPCIITLVIIPIIWGITHNEKNDDKPSINTPQITSRDANSNDIEIDTEMNWLSGKMDLLITPNTNINNLIVKIEYYDENDKLLFYVKESVGNVKKGTQITKKIGLSEYEEYLSEIDWVGVRVINGNVPYIQ